LAPIMRRNSTAPISQSSLMSPNLPRFPAETLA
jgi:hypothetical protein